MSRLYCMCEITGDPPRVAVDSQGFGPLDNQVFMAPNRYGVFTEDDKIDFRPVLLGRSMEPVKIGVEQRASNTGKVPSNPWPRTKEEMEKDRKALSDVRRHYPNVDLYRCPNCGAMIVLEGG